MKEFKGPTQGPISGKRVLLTETVTFHIQFHIDVDDHFKMTLQMFKLKTPYILYLPVVLLHTTQHISDLKWELHMRM